MRVPVESNRTLNPQQIFLNHWNSLLKVKNDHKHGSSMNSNKNKNVKVILLPSNRRHSFIIEGAIM